MSFLPLAVWSCAPPASKRARLDGGKMEWSMFICRRQTSGCIASHLVPSPFICSTRPLPFWRSPLMLFLSLPVAGSLLRACDPLHRQSPSAVGVLRRWTLSQVVEMCLQARVYSCLLSLCRKALSPLLPCRIDAIILTLLCSSRPRAASLPVAHVPQSGCSPLWLDSG